MTSEADIQRANYTLLRARIEELMRTPEYAWTGTWQGPNGDTEYVILKDGKPMEPGDVVHDLNYLEDIKEQVARTAKNDS